MLLFYLSRNLSAPLELFQIPDTRRYTVLVVELNVPQVAPTLVESGLTPRVLKLDINIIVN